VERGSIFLKDCCSVLAAWSDVLGWKVAVGPRLHLGHIFLKIMNDVLRQIALPGQMPESQRQFLSLVGRAPARLTVQQTAWMLNCAAHDIPILVAARVLKPLGNPPPNGFKFFATSEILALASDPTWLARMTNAIHRHWHDKNCQRGMGNS
jgi:hypothetical protein